jgi:hypothetical protein
VRLLHPSQFPDAQVQLFHRNNTSHVLVLCRIKSDQAWAEARWFEFGMDLKAGSHQLKNSLCRESSHYWHTAGQERADTALELGKSNLRATSQVELVLINLIILPILIRNLLKSGDWERQVVRDELADEIGKVDTPEEYEGVRTENVSDYATWQGIYFIQTLYEFPPHENSVVA